MEPENPPQPGAAPAASQPEPDYSLAPPQLLPPEEPPHYLRWIFIGQEGLRPVWSVILFLLLFSAFAAVFVSAINHVYPSNARAAGLEPKSGLLMEAASLLALAAALVARAEGRRIMAYNLTGPRRTRHFLFGLAGGFLALSALVGTLAAGGWLRFGPASLAGAALVGFGLLWACVFLMTGMFEEGLFRCYLQFTLARGINFWWALGLVAAMCACLVFFVRGSASVGVYAAAVLGLFPCLALHLKAAPRRGGFWYAAWVTSTLFGFVHISNPNEAGIGIFAAAAIGFVFCVSLRVTGSAWWAIGCHAGWDWGETYFYGTADSGLTPHGSYLSSTAAGNAFWSGGGVGPEGSVLVLGAILLLLVAVLVYGRMSRGQA